jgi:hypothetical protein
MRKHHPSFQISYQLEVSTHEQHSLYNKIYAYLVLKSECKQEKQIPTINLFSILCFEPSLRWAKIMGSGWTLHWALRMVGEAAAMQLGSNNIGRDESTSELL